MPGFNQRGPMNEGPMTGWGRGICNGNTRPVMGYGQGGYGTGGYGMGRGYGRRGCKVPGRGMGWGRNAAPWTAEADLDQTTLRSRAAFLESELAEIKRRLTTPSDSAE